MNLSLATLVVRRAAAGAMTEIDFAEANWSGVGKPKTARWRTNSDLIAGARHYWIEVGMASWRRIRWARHFAGPGPGWVDNSGPDAVRSAPRRDE